MDSMIQMKSEQHSPGFLDVLISNPKLSFPFLDMHLGSHD